MPEIVLRHRDKTVGPYILSVPNGVDPAEFVAPWAARGWTPDDTVTAADLRAEQEKDAAPKQPTEEPAEPVATEPASSGSNPEE